MPYFKCQFEMIHEQKHISSLRNNTFHTKLIYVIYSFQSMQKIKYFERNCHLTFTICENRWWKTIEMLRKVKMFTGFLNFSGTACSRKVMATSWCAWKLGVVGVCLFLCMWVRSCLLICDFVQATLCCHIWQGRETDRLGYIYAISSAWLSVHLLRVPFFPSSSSLTPRPLPHPLNRPASLSASSGAPRTQGHFASTTVHYLTGAGSTGRAARSDSPH